METDERQTERRVAELKPGDWISFWGDRYVSVVRIRKRAGVIRLTYLHPLTGLPIEARYMADDLVVVDPSHN